MTAARIVTETRLLRLKSLRDSVAERRRLFRDHVSKTLQSYHDGKTIAYTAPNILTFGSKTVYVIIDQRSDHSTPCYWYVGHKSHGIAMAETPHEFNHKFGEWLADIMFGEGIDL